VRGKRSSRGHRFGGDWTQRKLDVLVRYLTAYTNVLKNTSFEKIYIDAFAGTGYREARLSPQGKDSSTNLLFPDLAEPEPQKLLEGSARRALAVVPRFDRYIFIDCDAAQCEQLEGLRDEYSELMNIIEIYQGDANIEIEALCSRNWLTRRAVLFLDPYGMQVEWSTIETVAHTRAIDLWVLFPLGIGVNRLLTKTGEIPKSWRRRLDLLLGTSDWFDEFYRVEALSNLFGREEERIVKASTQTIGRYFLRRLEGVFAGVAPKPAVLRNSRNVPLYLLCFAVGNPRGKQIALRIANHLIKEYA
jgi:three-Cys-motif partner protein